MTQEELDALTIEWQRRLRLQGWTIVVKIKRRGDIGAHRAGQCTWITANRVAEINILDPIDYPNGCITAQDQEKTLIHELLHCHFGIIQDGWPDDDWKNVVLEQAIDAIALGCVDAKRSNGHIIEEALKEKPCVTVAS